MYSTIPFFYQSASRYLCIRKQVRIFFCSKLIRIALLPEL